MRIPSNKYRQLLERYLAPQLGAVLLTGTLLLASIALQLAGPQVARSFIDAIQASAGDEILIRAAFLFIGVSLVQKAMSGPGRLLERACGLDGDECPSSGFDGSPSEA